MLQNQGPSANAQQGANRPAPDWKTIDANEQPLLEIRWPPAPDFPWLLEGYRRKAGLSQVEVAERLGERLRDYEEIEAGCRLWTDPKKLDQVSTLFRTTDQGRDDLFDAAGLLPPELMEAYSDMDFIDLVRTNSRPSLANLDDADQEPAGTSG